MNRSDPQPFGLIAGKARRTFRARAISCGPRKSAEFSFTFYTDGPEVLEVQIDLVSAHFFLAGLMAVFPDASREPDPVFDAGGNT
jgi:hypothetical protein